MIEVQSTAKYVHISPRKARLVVDHIRGRSIPEARTILAFSQRAAAKEVEKVLRSAIANAETNPNTHWDGDELVISAAYVDEGPTLKRWRARARGRVSRINKRTCHITVKVTRLENVTPVSQPPAAAETPKRKPKAASPAKKSTPRKKKEAVA
jgi:large subunit ribosomal protein L22